MDINVKYLIEQFPGFKVLAGEGGLNKKVTTVSVMDAPDISNWMKGGEFLITTGYVMKDNPSNFKSLIVKLNDNKTAAMGIKLGRFIEELPQKVKDTANELNFPIVYIPTEYAFTDIINPVLSIVVNAQAKKLMTSEKINKTFTHLVMEGKGMKDIINELYSILGRSIYFVDLIFNRKYRKGGSSNFEQDTKILNYENLIDKYYNYLILMDNNHYGYIIIDEDKEGVAVTDLDKIAIQHASTVIILTIQKNISRQQIAQKYRGEFIQDLIVNNIKTVEEVNNRAKLY